MTSSQTVLLPEGLVQKFALYQVVEESQLQYATINGWRLLATVQSLYVPHSDGYQRSPEPKEPRYVTKYVLGKDEESAVRELNGDKSKLEEEVRVEKERRADMQKERDKVTEDLVALRASHAAVRERMAGAESAQQREKVLREKLERDLGKVREAIGSVRYNEIVGAK